MRLKNCDRTVPLLSLSVVVAAALALWATFARSPDSSGRSGMEPGEASHVRACEALVQQARDGGLVVGRPASNRIIVDERRWSDLPAETRRILASSVRCTAKSAGRAYGAVYGLRSGRRLALAHDAGVELD